jgi:uncharacterized protein (DUF2147 family)
VIGNDSRAVFHFGYSATTMPTMIRRSFALFALLCLLPLTALAQNTPLGRWRSIDDATGKPKAVIEVSQAGNGTLSAKIVQLIDTSDGPNPLCDDCSGARHNQPILGMTIAWGLKPQGKLWAGGRILDPENGKEYSVKMTPIAGGRKLEVRGFLGFSLLGRTQVWLRESP